MKCKMWPNTPPARGGCWNAPLGAALLVAVGLAGCGTTCFSFTSNPSAGMIQIKASDASTACRLTRVNGAVRVKVQTTPVCSACPESGRVQHIFVVIRGIAVHPSAIADSNSPDWEELLPAELVKQPLQVDLLGGTTEQNAQQPLGEEVPIPAGTYRQVRLYFAPDQSITDDHLPEQNGCGGGRINCIVMADGRIQPLLLDSNSPELITADKIKGGILLVPPGIGSDLVIELTPVWSWYSSGGGVRPVPSLKASARVERGALDVREETLGLSAAQRP